MQGKHWNRYVALFFGVGVPVGHRGNTEHVYMDMNNAFMRLIPVRIIFGIWFFMSTDKSGYDKY